MLQFRRMRSLQKFVPVHYSIHNHFNQERHLYSRNIFKLNRTAALSEWRQLAESFFNLLKRERIRRKTYKTREDARRDVFDYIEMFYNPKRKHARNGMRSPVEVEKQQEMKQRGV